MAIIAVLTVLLLLAGKSHFVPFERARTAITDWSRPALQAMNAPVVATSNWLSGLSHLFAVYKENLRLKEENARLLQWQGAATMLQERVRRYQLLLNSVSDPAVKSVAASVIGRSSRPFAETMILNAGATDQVQPGETVADARGVLGRIYLAGQHTAWVILLTDLNSRVPVSIEPANDQAILAGDNTEAPLLDAVAQGAKLKEGREVVTSGSGGLMPPGLPIGVLMKDESGFRVALYADPGTANDVRIMDFKQEQMPAPTDHDLPAAAQGFTPSPPPPQPVSAASTAPVAPSDVPSNGTQPATLPRKHATAPAAADRVAKPKAAAAKPVTAPPADNDPNGNETDQ